MSTKNESKSTKRYKRLFESKVSKCPMYFIYLQTFSKPSEIYPSSLLQRNLFHDKTVSTISYLS